MSFLPPGIDLLTAFLLILISFFTSALTAAFGIGGGVAMLGALAGSVPTHVIVAVHGLVQLGSNIGRAFLQKEHANWPLIARFSLGALIGVGLGAWLFVSLPERILLACLGIFILAMVWSPKPRLPGFSKAGMMIGGIASSTLTMFVGATGPFVQALLLPFNLDRKAMIANQAVMMSVQHLLKIIAFSMIGVALVPWLPLIALMITSGFIGTVLGTKLLDRLPERVFQHILKGLLSVIGLDLLRRAAGIALPF
jgi:uncharacterized protein